MSKDKFPSKFQSQMEAVVFNIIFQISFFCNAQSSQNEGRPLHLAQKYARIFVRGRYLFQEVISFLRE